MKSENILNVINYFKSVLPKATHRGHLNMGTVKVCNLGRGCGTIHCHGGWYAVARGLHKVNFGLFSLGLKTITYTDGRNQMAKDLGLRSPWEITDWAIDNAYLWGNRYGRCMFSFSMAFYHPTKRPLGAFNLQDIVDHWTEVYERVKAQEDAEKLQIVNELIESIPQPVEQSQYESVSL